MAVLTPEPLQITEPFRGRNDLRRNLVGLSRDELKTTLVESGWSRSAPARSGSGSTGTASPTSRA